MKRLILAALAAVTTAGWAAAPAAGTAPATAATPAISKRMHDDVMSLLQVTLGPRLGDITRTMSSVYVQTLQAKYRDITPEVADEIRADIAKVVADPERVRVLEESLVPVYAKLYTDAEIRQIIAFSKTPAGVKMFSGVPTMEQINEALQPWATGTVAPAIMMDTANILKQHNINVNPDETTTSTAPGSSTH